jgi:hypothetical protein
MGLLFFVIAVATSKSEPKARRTQKREAELLGVTRWYLNRVIRGHIKSMRLSKRLEQLRDQHKKPIIAVPIELAAAENLQPFFFATLAKLGLEVVIVRFKAGQSSPIWQYPEIERDLEKELQSAHAGQFDSEFYTPGARWFFYHVSDLAKAMQVLKATIESLGLLEITTLLHAETAQELRVWYPSTAELVNTEADTEA